MILRSSVLITTVLGIVFYGTALLKNLLLLGRFTKSGVERVQSYLQIKQVQSKDQGFYRCRVDFFQAPTRNVKVKLSLIGKKNIIVNFCNM